MRGCRWFVAVAMLLVAGKASASTDINGLFDARSHALGGSGAGYLDSAGAIPTNPSLLDQIGKLTISIDAFFIASAPEAPYTIWHRTPDGVRYQQYETIRSPYASAVLPFVGAAYRVVDRVVIGAAFYPMVGQGTDAKYRPAPDELPNAQVINKAALGLLEAGIPVSVKLLDNLSVAAMWRITYMTQSVDTAVPAGAPAGVLLDPMKNPISAKIDVTGVSFGGLQVGVFYKPIPILGLGFTYRSKVSVDGSGTTKTKNPLDGSPISLDTKSSFYNPHAFRVGAALHLFDDKLLLAADFKYLMYAEAFKELKTTTTMANGMSSTNVQPTHWKDSISLHLGVEYKLIGELLAARIGYIHVTSATPKEYAQAFMAPPGVSHAYTVGLGVKVFDQVSIDAAFAYVELQSKIDTPTAYNSGIGIYASHGIEASASATYRY